jgi:hypothetical protein
MTDKDAYDALEQATPKDANYFPPETVHNPEQVEQEQARAQVIIHHLEKTKP